jgi:hypothetical protein
MTSGSVIESSGLILRFSRIGPGLKALSLLSYFKGINQVCSLSNGPEFSLILTCDEALKEQSLLAYYKEISNEGLLRSRVFPKWNREIERAFFKLISPKFDSSCLVVESDDLGTLFHWGHEAFEQNLSIVEFSYPRSSRAWGFIVFTGSQEAISKAEFTDCDRFTKFCSTASFQEFFSIC